MKRLIRRQSGKTHGRQRAYTLVELLVVVGLVSMAFSTVAFTLHLLQRWNHQLRNEIPQADAVMRLSLRFRFDVHDSIEASLDTVPVHGHVVKLKQADGTEIVYGKDSTTIARRVLRNGEQVHLDRFRCPPQAELIWQTDGDPPSVVTLMMKRNKGRMPAAEDAVHVDRIDAALGIARGPRP